MTTVNPPMVWTTTFNATNDDQFLVSANTRSKGLNNQFLDLTSWGPLNIDALCQGGGSDEGLPLAVDIEAIGQSNIEVLDMACCRTKHVGGDCEVQVMGWVHVKEFDNLDWHITIHKMLL